MTKSAPQRILVLGALSAIAQAVTRLHAQRGDHLLLVARQETRLAQNADDLRARGAAVDIFTADLSKIEDATALFNEWCEKLGGVDVIYLFYGTLGDQERAQADLGEAMRIITTNYTSAAAWSLLAGARLARQKAGALVVISSVAGDRGRQSNFVYGSAKGGLSLLVQGIAHRLAETGARAVVVKLGFVDTPMTDRMDKKGFLWAKPAGIASRIAQAAHKGPPIQYVPWFWRFIMLIIRFTPAVLFHKTKL